MKRIILTTAGAAILALTACSQTAPPAAAPASRRTVAPIVPVSCGIRYHAWDHGDGKGVMAILRAVSSAGTAGDTHVLTAALRRARPALARAAHHPIPACADPREYWDALLMHVNAASDTNASASSVRAAMRDVPRIEHQLTAELKHTAPM